MTLETGKSKDFSLFVAESGNGKTMLMFLLMKAAHKPTLIIDNYNQFRGSHKSLKQLQDYFGDIENVGDFIDHKRQILISLKPTESGVFYEYIMACKFLSGTLIVNDEIDLTLGTSKISESHPYYEFCNRGRHLEFDHMVTARATQNVPKCLTQQIDTFYIGMAQNAYMIDFIERNISVNGLKTLCDELEPYRYLKISKGGIGSVESLKLDPSLLYLFS